jgi:hypothetical protein
MDNIRFGRARDRRGTVDYQATDSMMEILCPRRRWIPEDPVLYSLKGSDS